MAMTVRGGVGGLEMAEPGTRRETHRQALGSCTCTCFSDGANGSWKNPVVINGSDVPGGDFE